MTYDYREKIEFLTPSKEHKGFFDCPSCGKHKLGINKDDGSATCWTGSCERADIRRAIDQLEGRPEWKPGGKIEEQSPPPWVKPIRACKEIEYFYPGRDGKPLIKVTRKDDGKGGKKFPQSHWDGQKWVFGVPKEIRKQIPIYRYADVQAAIACGEKILWIEGEETADDLWAIGIAATTSIGGSGKSRSYGDYSKDFSGGSIILCPDRDEVGIEHMAEIYEDFTCQIEGYYLAGDVKGWKKPIDKRDIGDDIAEDMPSKETVLAKIITIQEFKAATSNRSTEGNATLLGEDEPTREEIGQRLLQQQEDFPLSRLFSSEVANPLTQYCDRTGVPQGALAIFVITCLATLVNPNTFLDCGGGTGNKARPIFWVANYGVSGSGKSHGWKPPMDILREFTSVANSKYKEEKQNWDTAARAIKRAKNPAELSALSEDTRELAEKEPPDRERFKMESFSIEALLKRQSKQPNRGLLAFADELLGWVQRMDPKKGEESLWLSLWLGDDLDGERIGRDVEYIERSAISVLGGIQPDVFRKLVEENEESQNGFLQRVILVRMPERPRPKMVNEPEPDYTPLKRIFENIKRYGGALELKLGTGGFEFAQKLKTFTDAKRLKESRKTIKALWPKFEATCYRIALILHLIENSDPDKVVPEDVPLKTLKTAWAYTEWLAGQAIQIYEEQLESDRVDVRVTEFVEAARYKDWMTVRDVRLLRRRWFKDTQEATIFMNRLVEMEYAETKLSPRGKPEFRISIFQKSGNMATNKTQNQDSKALQVLPSVGNSGNKTENNGCENHIQSQYELATVPATKPATKIDQSATEAPTNDPLPENVAGTVATVAESQDDGTSTVSVDETPLMLPLLPTAGNNSNGLRESNTGLNVAMLPLFEEVEVKKAATEEPIPEATDEEFS